MQAASKALTALRKMKSEKNSNERKRVKQEVSSIFSSKRPRPIKKVAWRHKFFCLSDTDQEKSPTCEADKEELFQTGLGEKEICFEDVNISQDEFHEVILENYPRLRKGGGFRFLKGKSLFIWSFVLIMIYFRASKQPPSGGSLYDGT